MEENSLLSTLKEIKDPRNRINKFLGEIPVALSGVDNTDGWVRWRDLRDNPTSQTGNNAIVVDFRNYPNLGEFLRLLTMYTGLEAVAKSQDFFPQIKNIRSQADQLAGRLAERIMTTIASTGGREIHVEINLING